MRGPGGLCSRRLAATLVVLGVAHAGVARADNRAAAEGLLRTLEHASVDDAVRHAKDALERATRMRVAGDEAHARLAEGLALEWAEAARDLARTLEVETQAHAQQVAAMNAKAKVEREQALLEEAIVRGGRLRVELANAKAKAEKGPATKDRTATFKATSAKPPPKTPASPPRGAKTTPAPATDADAPSQDVDGAGRRQP